MNTVEEIKELLQKNKKRLDKELQQSKEALAIPLRQPSFLLLIKIKQNLNEKSATKPINNKS